MRLATFNILHGRSLDDGRVDPARLADAVRTIDADVLALQEVDRAQPRSHRLDLTAVAAEAMGAVAHRFAAAIAGTPGGVWRPADGSEPVSAPAYGIALCSRYPVASWTVTRLPALPVRVPLRGAADRWRWLRDEPRVALTGLVDTPGGPLSVTATHLSFVFGWNAAQLVLLRRRLPRSDGPHLLLGDLNLPGLLPSRLTGMPGLVAARTFPRDPPVRQIDHILAAGGDFAMTAAGALELPLSDHRAAYADVAGW